MKLTESQLRKIIREELSKSALNSDLSSQLDYEKMLSLSQFQALFELLKDFGPRAYDDILSLKNDHDETSFHYAVRDLGIPAHIRNALWNNDSTEISSSAISKLKREFDGLSGRFKKEEITDETDRMYGRKSYRIFDTKNGETIKTFTDRKGSLGT